MGNEKLREAFNEFVKLNGCSVMKRDGEYVESMTRLWWKCWQAATAANQRDAMAVADAVEAAISDALSRAMESDDGVAQYDLAAIVEAVPATTPEPVPSGPVMHMPSGYAFDEVIAAASHDDLVALTPQPAYAKQQGEREQEGGEA